MENMWRNLRGSHDASREEETKREETNQDSVFVGSVFKFVVLSL